VISWQAFTWLDWGFVVIVALSTLFSLLRGFTREALSLLGWVAAFVLANLFASSVASHLSEAISNLSARYIAAWLLVFAATLVAATLLAVLVGQVVRATGLGALDRLFGMVFGFARGVVIVLVLVFLARELLAPRDQQWLYQAQLMPQIDALMNWALQLLGRWDMPPPALTGDT
jgi:membrane protein required for colicin V production|tara:strand:- start:1651 stop:2172 length:522 start_codon:yes stop_codon:yes gene_type:complete